MVSDGIPPKWISTPPAAFDIVACHYPESNPRPDARLRPRPALVLNVFRDKKGGGWFCEVAYGTKNLKLTHPAFHLDLVIQNAADLRVIGLACATRFNLEKSSIVILPWSEQHFACWSGYPTPVIGALTQPYVQDFTYRMALRQAEEQRRKR